MIYLHVKWNCAEPLPLADTEKYVDLWMFGQTVPCKRNEQTYGHYKALLGDEMF